MRIIDQQILEALETINFSFDSRHHFTQKESKEVFFDSFWINIQLQVRFSNDLEEIIEKDVSEFYVFANNGDEIETDLSDKQILKAINII